MPGKMTRNEANLWDSLCAFTFDTPDNHGAFAARLSRRYGWKAAYTERVMTEYRKFLFICCVSLFEVDPSDAEAV